MKTFLVELDDRCARDLERVAPARSRMRAEFVRLAIRRAVDLALDRATADAYREQPLAKGVQPGDTEGWDEQNALAVAPRRARTKRGSKNAA